MMSLLAYLLVLIGFFDGDFAVSASSNDCDDFLVSGTQSLVSPDFPTEARLFNDKGWVNGSVTIDLTTNSKIKKIAFQACDTDSASSTSMYFKIFFRSGTGWAYYVDMYFNQMFYPVISNCQAIKLVDFTAETTAVKVTLFQTSTAQSFRVDVVGCPNEQTIPGTRTRWMTSQRLTNVNVTDRILWIRNSDTMFQCSKECENDASCDSFVVSDDGKCQGHKIEQTTTMPNIEIKPGVQFYIKNDGYKIESKTGLLYKIYSQKREPDAAKTQCNDDGGHLIALYSMEHIQAMWKITRANYILAQESQFTVSGYADSSGKWKYWNDIEIPDALWESGTAADSQACFAMGFNGFEKTQCNPLYFICQKPLFVDQVLMG